ncbi:hypothetical protein I317_07649 [Kwoniella heveanensis CBS 569]|nr:hypothetical protein I317_07649 [Kwoniella heveanensis CBS 569]
MPFFRDPLHTMPVKWGLYRPLLKQTKGVFPAVHREIRSQWKRWKGMTSVPRTKGFLEEYHTLLEYLSSTSSRSLTPTSIRTEEPSIQTSPYNAELELQNLEARLLERHSAADLKAADELSASQSTAGAKSTGPARLTGGFHRPTLFNPPLPRLKPQPIGISMMIQNRLRKRERRHARRKVWASLLSDMRLEVSFWKDLERASPNPDPNTNNVSSTTEYDVASGTESGARGLRRGVRGESDWTKGKDSRCPGGWDGPIQEELRLMDARFRKENSRAESVYSEELMERVAQAKSRRKDKRRAKKLAEREKKREASVKIAQTASISTLEASDGEAT